MSAKPTLGELLLGIEGLALLRLAFGADADARRARVNEIRALLARLEDAPEYDLMQGYGLWSRPMTSPCACSRSRSRPSTGCSIRSPLRSCSMPHAEPGATARTWRSAGTG
jgi:hypothetical protein